MSRAAVAARDRRRELREVPIPKEIAQILEPGSSAYVMGGCHIICSRQLVGWHLSISHPKRMPKWEELRDARYALIPNEATMALLLPPLEEYVNVHEFCLQMYEIPSEYIERYQDRCVCTPLPEEPRP